MHVQVSVQYQVLKERIEDSFYKLTNQADQIRSYVFDVVRSTVPKLNLDDVFVSKEVRHQSSVAKCSAPAVKKLCVCKRFAYLCLGGTSAVVGVVFHFWSQSSWSTFDLVRC
jgi:hypothetical protein